MSAYRRKNFKRKKFNSSTRYRKDNSVVGKFVGILLAMLFVILLVAVAGFVFFNNSETENSKWGSEKLEFIVAGSDQVSSGGQVEYTIHLENQGNINLNEGELSVTFPEGFVLNKVTPSFDKDNTSGGIWNIDQLKAYQEADFIIEGNLFGEIGEAKVFSLAMNYKPENFSSSFLETSSYETRIKSSVLDLSFDIADEIVSGQENNNTIKITESGEGDVDFDKLKVVLEYPDGFELTESNYSASDGSYSNTKDFIIEDFGNSATLEIKNIISGDNNEKKNIKIRVYSLDENNNESPEIVQVSKTIYITKPAIDLNLLIEDSQDNEQSLRWGDKVDFEVQYKNNWDRELNDLMLKVSFSGDNIYNWDSAKFYGELNQGYISEIDRGQMFIFNKFVCDDFETLNSDTSGSIRFKIDLDEKPVNLDIAESTIQAEITAGDFVVKSNKIKIKLK